MNHVFRIIWSQVQRAWVVVSELASRRGKGGGVDKRRRATDVVLDRDAVEGSPPATAWPLRMGILVALWGVVYMPAIAADRWWDSNNTAIGFGGTGTWSTTDPFWSPNNDGVSGPYSAWNNGALDDAFFGGTVGTITLGEPITVHNLNFVSGNGWVLNGSTLTLDGTDPTITNAGTVTINSVVNSTSGLIKAGGGILTLNASNTFNGGIEINGGRLTLNAANTFFGDINVNSGALFVSGDTALGDVGNMLNMAASTTLNAGDTGGNLDNRTVNLTGVGQVTVSGAGLGSNFFTGTGGISVASNMLLDNEGNDYTGKTSFVSSASFTSIGNLGETSSLGAPTTVADGTIAVTAGNPGTRVVSYVGNGDTSNRNWTFQSFSSAPFLVNSGTGTLTLTGNIAVASGSQNQPAHFNATTADLELLGVISGSHLFFNAAAGQTVTLGDNNTYGGNTTIAGEGQVLVGTLANYGMASSLGTGGVSANIAINSGTLSYTGSGDSSNRNWSLSNGTLSNDGTGALTLSGTMAIGNTASLGGSFTGADNVYSGVIAGAGNLRSAGDATWVLNGANTYTGNTIVDGGVLRAGTTDAFGASGQFTVNSGTLDLSSFDQTIATLTGTGGTLDLGSATLTLEADEGTSASYAGSIIGTGGLTKLGGSEQTLTGASSYTGDTTIGGGALNLDFSGAGGPTSNIIGSGSTLNMSGGTLNVIGADGESNTQTFDGLNVTAGINAIDISSGTGGSATLNLGAITRTGGLLNFELPDSGSITTSNGDMFLAWAIVNGTEYAKVEGGLVLAFEESDYTDQDDASLWMSGQVISDDDGDTDGFFGTVTGSVQLGGLQYTQPVATTVTVNPGETLGVDAPIIVSPSVLNNDQLIQGGMMTGGSGTGDSLSIQQNSTGNFTIDSQIVDNGNNLGFFKSGEGLVTLGSTASTYTGPTVIAEGTLAITSVANAGAASSIGAASTDPANLVLQGSKLQYTGTGDSSDRGFTFSTSGAILGVELEVTDPNANLTFSGLVTSPDDASFTKSGPGTLTLANPNNDYVGITTVTGGFISVDTLPNGGVVSPIGQSSSDPANLVLDGGGLRYTGATASTDRGTTLGPNDGTIDVTNAATELTVSGNIVGTNNSLTKEGDGTLILSGTNTYTGGNTVNGGVLRAGSTQAFGGFTGQPTTLADVAGVTLDLDGFDNMIGPLNGGGANGGNVTLGSATLRIVGGNGDYSGVISGTGGIWRTNGGTQTFNGCNHTYTGVTNLGANLSTDCLLDGGLASGIGASSAGSTNLQFNGGTLIYTGGSIAIDRGFQLLGAGGIQVTEAAATLEFEGDAIGGGSLSKSGAGTLVLSGTNTYTGNTTVAGGVLRAAATNAFGPQGHMILNNTAGVRLDLDSFDTVVTSLIGGGANGGNIDLGSATLTLNTVDNRTYAGAITGTGNLVKNGNTIQALSGCGSDYTGTTTINAGTLQVTCLEDGGLNSSIGASSSDPANLVINGTLNYVGSGGSTNREFTLGTSGGTIGSNGSGAIDFSFAGPVTLAGTDTARTLTLTGNNTGTNIFSAQLDDNGTGATSLTKTGNGLWRLTSATSSYTGVTTINGGILEVNEFADGGMASSIGAASSDAANLVIGNESTLRYTGAGDSSDRQFTLAPGVSFIESSGTGALLFTNTGAVGLSGADTARTMALGGTNTGDNTFGGAIGDNGTGATTLAKNDSGTWILTGNNTFTGNTVINDGNLIIGNGGTTGNAGAGDVIVANPTSTLSLNRSDTFTFDGTLSGPGTLAQIGSGTSILTSLDNAIGATTIENGTLQVDGGLETPTVDMTGTSELSVNGTVQADGPTQTLITGDAGDQTITVGTGGLLLANGDLGDGNDIIDLTGTLDTGIGTLALGDGDDTLILNDGAQMLGAGVNASGGGGTDTLVVNTVLGFALDGGDIDTFNILTKQNSGELTLTGDHDFDTGTNIEAGTVNVDGALITPALSMDDDTTLNVDGLVQGQGETQTTITGSAGDQTINVGSGGALLADGDLGDGNDTVTLAGYLDTGAGTLGLGAGDDTLTLRDGAVIEGGGVDAGAGTNDTLILDNALALTFDGGQTAGFELLQKDNAGEATITGTQTFSGGTALNAGTLTVAGDLETVAVDMADGTTLNVDGSLQDSGGTPVAITGSAGTNTVTVGADGTLIASGSLGEGADVLDVAGTLDTGGFVFDLGDGDDTLTVHDGTTIIGTVAGGAGTNTFNTHIDTVADLGAVQSFQVLSKTGIGVLNINGLLDSDFNTVEVLEGTLDVTAGGSVVAPPGETLDTVVASGATLNVDGSYTASDFDDTFEVSGTVSGTGTIDLGAGADTLTLNDGAVLANAIDGGAGSDDTLVLNNAQALTFDGGSTSGFEFLQKDNVGTATMIGSQSFVGGAAINGGTLDVDGGLETPTVVMADGTTLNVDGTLEAGGGTAADMTGSAGDNTVTVGAGGTLLATGDLGAGEDTLDVTGTLDTGGGVFNLGDGDDNFIVHDGTVVIGIVDGGAGFDTRTYDINTSADLGALVNFEGVTKTGTGVLNITGPGATDLQQVEVLEGTLDVQAGASIVATPGEALDTVVASGATLNVDGDYGCGDQADTMDVSGTVSGSGTVNLCGGDDTLTLNDGADIAGLTNPIDGDAGDDTVVLNNASDFTLDGSDIANFEVLQKDNTGEATLTGVHEFSGGTALNAGTLTVDGALFTPTVAMGDDTVFNVEGFAAGSAMAPVPMDIQGSAGNNTVNIAQGAVLIASGDLGDGEDVLDVAGVLDTGGGVFSLGAGDDTFTIHDGTQIVGTVDGGAGQDIFNPNINTSADLGALTNFEVLSKTGIGVLNVNGPDASGFDEVSVLEGTLNIGPAGAIDNVQATLVAGGATLNVDGSYTGSAGDDTFTVAGTVTGNGTVDLGDGDDTFTIQDGADLSGLATPVSGGAGTDTFVADLAGEATLGGAINFETLTKTNTGTLHVAGPAESEFSTVNVLGGALDIGVDGEIAGVRDATVASGAILNIDGNFLFTGDDDVFTVAGTVSGLSDINMLDGNDTLVIQDGADLSGLAGPVDGGDGDDTLVTDIAGTATLGGATNFETLNKTNTGTLIVAGPAQSDFTTVNLDGGTLDIGPQGDISGVVTTNIAAGTVFNVDGNYAGSDGDDTMTVAGTVSGSGPIGLGDGDDTLTLNDGADFAGYSGALAGGTGSDTVVLNNSGDLAFGAGSITGFETLQKNNGGTATLFGAHDYSDSTELNGGALVVADRLTTPVIGMAGGTTLTVDGQLQGPAGSAAEIVGGAGDKTLVINGSALAHGDLGDGNDVLDVVGVLATQGGVLSLGGGDDTFTIHDGTHIIGTVDGGTGTNTFNTDIDTSAELGAVTHFQVLDKTGAGVLNVNGPGVSDFGTVNVNEGILNIGPNGSVIAPVDGTLDTFVASGAVLNVDGAYGCGDGNDTLTVAGTVSGSGTVDLCAGDDTLVLLDGAVLETVIDGNVPEEGSDWVIINNTISHEYDLDMIVNFEHLVKENSGEAILVGSGQFTGDTAIEGGTLTVAGQLGTPIVAMSDDTVLNVTGTLDGGGGAAATLTGSAGTNTVTVGADGTLLATGDLGDGSDVLDVAGTLDTGDGVFALGAGDDTLTIHDNTNIIGTVVAGAGTDTLNADIATRADLGAVQEFEVLTKTNAGVLNVNGPASSDFIAVNVDGGTLHVAEAGSVAAQHTTVGAGATLNIAGSYTGTDGDDTFTSRGTVNGALAFGGGNDTAHFIGGDISGLTAIDGGGGNNLLRFSTQDLDDANLAVVSQWQRVELLDNTTLTQGRAFNLAGGTLFIDPTSQWIANAGAALAGNVENAGLIQVGGNRLAIGGSYTGIDGALQLTVSPGTLSAGGLDIDGDVRGTTFVRFESDGSDFTGGGEASILVIASPNDDLGTAGGFAPAEGDGFVRLEGSLLPWNFGQQEDNNWYLSAEAGVLPEVPAYGVLPSLALLAAQDSDNLIHQRLAGVRGSELPECGIRPEWPVERAGSGVIDDCRGVWTAVTYSDLELGANPGFEVSGENVGLYVGVDSAFDREGRTLRGGLFLGYRHGNYWTTGVNSTELPGSGIANVGTDTLFTGMYMSHTWDTGGYVNFVLTGQLTGADVRTPDGFSDSVTGNALTFSSRAGREYRLNDGWSLEPQVQLNVSAVNWGNLLDASGKQVMFDDDLVTTARAALRVEKTIERGNGAVIRPWATLGVQRVMGENENSVTLATPGALDDGLVFPNHDLGTSATLDLGLEATINQRLSAFGVLSLGRELDGTDYEQRGAYIGIRARW